MASVIYTGLILFALLHFGMSYTVWSKTIFNATLGIFKSVNKATTPTDLDVESKLLAGKLKPFLELIQVMQWGRIQKSFDPYSSYVSYMIKLIVHRSNDPKLQKAEEEINKTRRLLATKFTWFMNNDIFPNETQAMIREALELDNEESFENRKSMSNLYEMCIEKYPDLRSDVLSSRFIKSNIIIEWNTFVMITTAYKLKSLESNDDNYVEEFHRLRKQFIKTSIMHETKFEKALSSIQWDEKYD